MGRVSSWRAAWVAEPAEGRQHDRVTKHLFDPGCDTALCGVERGPGWTKPTDELRCAGCVKNEERL